MASNGKTVTRRSFLAAVGVGAAAAAAPTAALAAAGGPSALIPALRDWYTRERERFLGDVKAELVAGTMGDPDESDGDWLHPDYAPSDRLEEAVRERFSLQKAAMEAEPDGGVARAYLLVAVATNGRTNGGDGWEHASDFAAAEVVEDVLQEAERRGWVKRPE